MNQNKNRYMPLLMALCVVIGIIIGSFYANHSSGNRLNIINSGSKRLNDLLHIIDDQYVDKVDVDSLVEKAIPQILAELDPHSVYINAKDVQAANDDLKGSFSGVGIEFTIRQDTIHVQNVIKNGPAERAGLLAGDKIVTGDGKKFVGKAVTNEEAMHRLKGPKDTKVRIGVLRYGQKKVKEFTVTRGDIPLKSIGAAYMLDDSTGYIRIKSFGESRTAYSFSQVIPKEFLKSHHRFARQYGRLPAIGRTDSERIPTQQQTYSVHPRSQIAPPRLQEQWSWQLSKDTSRGFNQRRIGFSIGDICGSHAG